MMDEQENPIDYIIFNLINIIKSYHLSLLDNEEVK
jgi:hypothetical protein